MLLLKEFTEKEILEIIVKHAAETLPKESNGILEGAYSKENGIRVYFIKRKGEDKPS
jgi:hypothetical protein